MKAIVIVACVLGTTAAVYGGQQSFSDAKEMYASAAYEEALTTFAGLYLGAAPEVKRQIDEYRAFCLYALGRTGEAESVAESLIRTNPLIQLDESETSPRIQTMFAAVRKRLLPDLIRDEYRAARAAREAKNPTAAEPHLVAARGMLDEAQRIGAWSETLGEMAELIDGFLDLARARPSQAIMATEVAPSMTEKPTPPAPAEQPISRPVTEPSVYDSSDRDVSPPVPIHQAVPNPPRMLLTIMRAMGQRGGKVDVLIDEVGSVQDVIVRESVNSGYDDMVVSAARNWKYEPALKDGRPVRYLKVVSLTVSDKN